MEKIDIMGAFCTEPPPQDFVLPGLLAGTVASLIAPGSTGKSNLALQIACAIACLAANTTGFKIDKQGKVLYLNLEDPPIEIQRRLYNLGSYFSPEIRQSLSEGLIISPRQGVPTDVMNDAFLESVVEMSRGFRLIVIDTLSRAHSLNENDNGEMARLVGRLEMIARQTGAAVLFLHHTSKSAAMNGSGDSAQASRGAAALIDNGRWCANMMKMSEDEAKTFGIEEDRRGYYVRYVISKQNYGEVDVGSWFERKAGGILAPIQLEKKSERSRNKNKGRDDI